MSKAVLISIQPKWCRKIANKEKTVEVRKTKPKIDTPFKCYIYCTKPKYPHENVIIISNGFSIEKAFYCGRKVIGEFICDRIMLAEYESLYGGYIGFNTEWSPNDDCLTNTERLDYGFGKEFIYGWHISDLKIYDKPKELSEFRKPCIYGEESEVSCFTCDKSGFAPDLHLDCFNKVTRPPQSWCYVEK